MDTKSYRTFVAQKERMRPPLGLENGIDPVSTFKNIKTVEKVVVTHTLSLHASKPFSHTVKKSQKTHINEKNHINHQAGTVF